MSRVNYTVRYGILNSNDVLNLNGPEFKPGTPTHAWDVDSIRQRNEFAKKYIQNYNKNSKDFYTKLENSILEKGIQDPLVVSAGDIKPKFFKYLPEYMQNDKSKILACIGPGCSRLYFAQKYEMKIPCIILDFVKMFPNFERIDSKEQAKNKWTNNIKDINFGNHEVNIRGNVYFD